MRQYQMRKFLFRRIITIAALALLCAIPLYKVSADKDPRPNDSMTDVLMGNISAVPAPNLTPPPVWEIGMTHLFRVMNIANGELQFCSARVFFITDNIVFWLDEKETQPVPEQILMRLQQFDRETLPMMHGVFGEENKPGIDNDLRFHVLFTDLIGEMYNGYFSSEDTVDPRIRSGSNGMDLLILNTALFPQGGNAVINTLSHEFQHMIHYHYDQNEQSFINEGLSGLAEYLVLGSTRDTFIRNYLYDTGRSLIWWPESGNNAPYYGSSFLFCTYLYDRFGADLIHELVRRQENGLNGIDEALQSCRLPYSADDVFQQWTAALLGQLLRSPVKDWNYRDYIFPQQEIYRDIKTLTCNISEIHETAQYGIRFYNTTCPGSFRITVEGRAESPVTSLPIPSGDTAWWGGAYSNAMSLLSHDFDLKEVSEPVLLEYDTVFDIEEGYDYYYLTLTDETGKVHRLSPSTATEYNPAEVNLGSGSTGKSGGVLHEAIDLSKWRGQKIRVTFVYLTDTSGEGDGILLDNIEIKAAGFLDSDGETQGWQAEGFSKIQKTVPQRFSLTILHPQNNGTSRAEFRCFDGGSPVIAECPEGNCAFAVSPVKRDIRARTSFTVRTDPYPFN